MATNVAKSHTFTWQGTDKSGHTTKGEISGTSLALVKAQLRKQGIAPTKVRKKQKSLLSGDKKGKITPGDIALFTRQMGTMMKAGVPLVQAFDIVADGLDSAAMKEMIGQIRTPECRLRLHSVSLMQWSIHWHTESSDVGHGLLRRNG